ncbi:MAG: YciI family protein [Arenimonas sp.]
MRRISVVILMVYLGICHSAFADQAMQPVKPPLDSVLAKQLGADENGMRHYVLVILKTGKHRVPDGKARDEMFQGHFANIKRLADEGKLAVAGPFGDKNDWRGMFIFAVESVAAAESLVATDPVIKNGEMVAEYHSLYSSAALMSVNGIHQKITSK